MEIEELFGLPAHPLFVHAAVVLLPLAVLTTVVAAALPRMRTQLAPVAVGLAVVALGAVVLAQGSGEALEEKIEPTELIEEHAGQGERVLPWAIGTAVAAAAVAAAPAVQRRRPDTSPGTVTAVVMALTLIAGAGAIWSVVDVGHSGAKATWDAVATGEEE